MSDGLYTGDSLLHASLPASRSLVRGNFPSSFLHFTSVPGKGLVLDTGN